MVVVVIGIGVGAGCSTREKVQIADTVPHEPATRACETKIEADGIEGTVRYVTGDGTRREIWDEDGDGAPDREVRRTYDDRGRASTIEHVEDGEVVARFERRYDENRLIEELGDRYDAEGRARPDGVHDSRRTLRWEGDRLAEETIDERDADMLPGVDGSPEFRIVWSYEGEHPVEAVRYAGETAVARQVERWEAGKLVERQMDYGADGTVDVVETFQYDGDGRLVVERHEGVAGDLVLRHSYCSGES